MVAEGVGVPTAQDRYASGLSLFHAGHHHLADAAFRDALAIDPAHHLAHALLALTLINLGRHREALDEANAALAVRPGLDALRARALALAELGQPLPAVAAGREAVALAPENAWAAYTLGVVLERAKRPQEAEPAFRRAADLAPGTVMFRAEHARLLIRLRKLGEAEAIAATIAAHADVHAVLVLRGEIALWRGRNAEARDLALWVLSRNARHRQALSVLTLASAHRDPLLKLWWHYHRMQVVRPVWGRVLWLAIAFALSAVLPGLPFVVVGYFLFARSRLKRRIAAELAEVRLRPSF